jgi:hypothetical protein
MHSVQTGSEAPQFSFPIDIAALYLEGKVAGLLSSFGLVSVSRTEVKNWWDSTSIPPHVFVFYFANKQRTIFTCTF